MSEHGLDLFEFYRFMLAVLVITYGTIRLAIFIWRWQGLGGRMGGSSAVFHRYVTVLLLRIRFRRFAYELLVIGGLATALALLIRAHR